MQVISTMALYNYKVPNIIKKNHLTSNWIDFDFELDNLPSLK